jgi:hypothetical protein
MGYLIVESEYLDAFIVRSSSGHRPVEVTPFGKKSRE